MRQFNRIIVIMLIVIFLLSGVLLAASKSVYPLKTNVTLTWWMELHPNVASIARNQGDTEFAKELQRRTGVKIKFLHPPVGQAREAFNLMLASGDLPDIIEYYWYDIPGGPNSAIENGYVVKLNPIMNKWTPNLKKFLKDNPEYDRMAKTDEGNYFAFPFVRGDETLIGASGPIIRKDWLDELGLKVPETIDEWYVVLKAFKEKKNATAPLSVEASSQDHLSMMLAGGFDNTRGFYVDKKKIKFGGIEPGRKKYLETMRQWYAEGLIDPNFMTTTRKVRDSNIMTGKSGATFGAGGSVLGNILTAMEKSDPKFNLVGVKFPTPKKGELPRFAFQSLPIGGYNNNGNAVISAKCRNVEVAARLLDYAYSEEGKLLYNFGIEGVSYKMVNGYPTYTDLIMKNTENLSLAQIMAKYIRGHMNGPFVQDKRYIEQYYQYQQQKDAILAWKENRYRNHVLPPITPNAKESEELARIMNDINTYMDEMSVKFIMGLEPIANFDKYIAEIKKLGIDRAIAINQAALDRYYNRK